MQIVLAVSFSQEEMQALPENCSLVSFTSGIVKVFKRFLKKKLVDFLEVNALVTGSQHRLRAGRSTLS